MKAIEADVARPESGTKMAWPKDKSEKLVPGPNSLSGSPNLALSAIHPLALILAGVAAPVWGLAGLALSLTLLVWVVLVLSSVVGMVLAPHVLAYRSWPDCCLGWLCRPDSFVEPWSWLCRCWLRWPWLSWSWLRQGS
jgi:hypothetical protein